MASKGIVQGQKVTPSKLRRSQELRKSMTPQEAILWRRLRANQLDGLHFRRQQIIDGFVADFYCHSAGVVIELDGSVHHHQRDHDRERDKVIASHNLVIIRVGNAEVDLAPEQLLHRIQLACRARTE